MSNNGYIFTYQTAHYEKQMTGSGVTGTAYDAEKIAASRTECGQMYVYCILAHHGKIGTKTTVVFLKSINSDNLSLSDFLRTSCTDSHKMDVWE